MIDMSDKYSNGNRIYLIIILAFATAVTVTSSLLTYRNSINAAEDSLKLQTLGIAVSLEASLSKTSLRSENIFKDIITEGKWEGIAFIALYDKSGTTLLHSNENLIGRQVQNKSIKAAADTGKPVYEYITLGTGERVFAINFPAHIHNSEKILRLTLHTYPAQNIVRQARLQLISISIVILLLWITGYFFIKAVNRSEELRKVIVEKERLAMLGEMASVLAHEIRNPLGSIKGFAQYLSEQDSAKKELLDIIVSESKRLERLTDDMLVYARPVELRLEEISLHELINDVVQSLQPTHNTSSNIDIKTLVPTDIKVNSDRDKLRQILINIIQNSIDAVNENGIIEIKTEPSDDKITILVSDNGRGMDNETKQRAFKPFFTTKTMGTGLGLAIVDKLIKSISGTIELESEPHKGSTFRITIPRNLI